MRGGSRTADLPSSGAENRARFEFNAERHAKQKLEQKRKQAAQAGLQAGAEKPAPTPPWSKSPGQKAMRRRPRASPSRCRCRRQILLDEAKARYRRRPRRRDRLRRAAGLVLVEPFLRLGRQGDACMAGAYEREAIRPHVLGRFADMLLAVESHPAMLIYLDNARSIGPNSVAGINRDRGLNENLAREILELHTLGVRTVYTQDDVTSFAKVITGWTIVPTATNPEHGGEFVFNRAPARAGRADGDRQELSATPASSRAAPCSPISRAIRRPRSTSRTKLARHFVADEPPPALVERLDASASSTPTAISRRWPRRWSPRRKPGRAARPSSSGRANGSSARCARPASRRPTSAPVMQAQNLLGEPLWRPPAPKGFSDDNAAWLDGLAQRLDIANQLRAAHRRRGSTRRRCSTTALGAARLGRRRGRRSRAPRAGRRRWRCC